MRGDPYRSVAFFIALAVTAGCGDNGGTGGASSSGIPSAADLVGSYDVTSKVNGFPVPPCAGVVRAHGRELSLRLASIGELVLGPARLSSLPKDLTLHGTLRTDGSVSLEGTSVSLGNTIADGVVVRGSARVEQRSGTFHIVGSVDNLFGAAGAEFEMQRAVNADARLFSGHLRLTFFRSPGLVCLPCATCPSCETSADVVIDVAADGTGILSAATEVDVSGAAVGTLGEGPLSISPTGFFALTTSYETPNHGCNGALLAPDEPCALSVYGALPAPDTDGSTSAYLGLKDSQGRSVLVEDGVLIRRLSEP